MSVPSICSICNKYSVELRVISADRASCSICRTLDRIRGICLRLPESSAVSTLSLLYDTEARLQDLRHFEGQLPEGSVVRLEPPGPQSLSSLLDKEPKVSHETSSSGNPAASHSTTEPASAKASKVKKRHKKNRGTRRKEWQQLRCDIHSGRHQNVGGGEPDFSGSESDVE